MSEGPALLLRCVLGWVAVEGTGLVRHVAVPAQRPAHFSHLHPVNFHISAAPAFPSCRRDLIDTCFRRLRSVDAAAELLHSFQRIHVRGWGAATGLWAELRVHEACLRLPGQHHSS